ncbi:MAG: HAMP domain-containing histidine kinase [Deltaproteobacteria bacterium]|nr:HAMP domain-containing histidine kinase [Deltaproteobacteria bacterium]
MQNLSSDNSVLEYELPVTDCQAGTIWRGLRVRILVASMICAAISLLIINVLMVRGIVYGLTERISGFNQTLMRGAEGDRCRAAPSEWSMQPDPQSFLFAYDRHTFKSANPLAPKIDPEIVASINAGNLHALNFHTVDGEWGQAATVISEKGVCSLLLSGWQPRSDIRAKAIIGFLILLVLSLVLTAGTAMVLVVRPLLARIAKLRASAATVGTAGYRSTQPMQSGDELQVVHSLLDRAHHRIRSDAELLEARNRSLAEHLSNVAHDMRTPIASLQLALERLSQVSRRHAQTSIAQNVQGEPVYDDTDAKDHQETDELITTSLLDAVYIGALTDNLRIAAQLKDGIDPASEDAKVDIGVVVDAVISRLRLLAERKGIHLEAARPDEALWVRCHPVMAEQMVQNFVQNAVAYGEVNGHVSILLESVPNGKLDSHDDEGVSDDSSQATNDASFCLQVLDDGPGVPPEDLPRLGERTFRSDDARTRDGKGTGLGLAIAAEIATRCRFELGFSAISEGGFCVTLHGRILPNCDEDCA